MASQRSVNRIVMNVALDGALASVAAVLARWVADPGGGLLHPLWFVAGGAITLVLGGLPFRLAQQYWRFAGVEDLLGVAGGSIVSAALFAALLLGTGFSLPTATFPIVHALTLMLLLGAPRVVYRLLKGRHARSAPAVQAVLLVGAGEGADAFLRALSTERGAGLRVMGLLALGRNHTGQRMQGRPILGGVSDIRRVLERLSRRGALPDALVITEPHFAGSRLGYVLQEAQAHAIPVRQAPRPTELRDAGGITLKPIALEDLLNRPQVPLDREGMARLVRGRRVLVTGAGGTIGSELVRQVAALGPGELVLLDHSEYALWQIDQEIGEQHPAQRRRAVIADVRDKDRIQAAFDDTRPELIFHAAALKHVPMMEANPLEALLTNAFGTRVVVDAGRASGARAMVMISTDKAVNPSSVMGASKRLAEMYCQAVDDAAGMRCVTVRFGNVLGSTGSVVPIFRRQLERGGPLTVTHPDMQRYFMTVREAVALVLQATVVAIGGRHDGGIFVLDMGKPVKIVDLARQMIRLAGLRPDGDVAIQFTGLRPGEKLYEELFHGREPPVPTAFPGLLIATPRVADRAFVGAMIESVAAECRAGRRGDALALLGRLIPEFEPTIDEPREEPCLTDPRLTDPRLTDIAFLDLKAQQARIEPELRRRLEAVLQHCQFILGPEVGELEERLAAYCGAAHCVAVSSGTDALQIALMAEGVGPGDAVFLPAFTYTATAEVPLLLGATPVFVDVDPATFQIDPAHLAARIAAVRAAGRLRPRALIGVDLFGQPADWPALTAVAGREGLFTVDDCAQSFGASLHGAKLGRAADATAVSFFPSKPLGGYGDGGALLTDSADRAALYRSLRSHGEGTTRYEVLRTGVNGRLDTLQAAVLLAKLSVFDAELARREQVARGYDQRLGNLVGVPARVVDASSAWAVYAILLPDAESRTRLQQGLRAAGVPSAVYYPRALHQQPAYAAAHDGVGLPVSEDLATRIMALPIHPDLTEADVQRVCDAVAGVLGRGTAG